MMRLSVWVVRTALVYLGIGLLIGALMLAQKGVPIEGTLLRLLPLHIEVVLVGWTLQLGMGIAFWILPRFSHEPRYGREVFGWLAYGLLNIGVLSVGVGQWLGAPSIIMFVGRVAEVLAVVSFAAHAWPRIKPLGA
jgi:cbb3-type cytochrome oxidase subunit 1